MVFHAEAQAGNRTVTATANLIVNRSPSISMIRDSRARTPVVEHPDLVAERILPDGNLVGADSVVGGRALRRGAAVSAG